MLLFTGLPVNSNNFLIERTGIHLKNMYCELKKNASYRNKCCYSLAYDMCIDENKQYAEESKL